MEIRSIRCLWRGYWILCYLTILFTVHCTPNPPRFQAKGPPTVVLSVEESRHANGILNGIGNLGLWCQAIDSQTRRAVPIKSASFRHGSLRFEAKLSANRYNASFVREKSPAIESGTWKCDVYTEHNEKATGIITVYVRPVIHTNSSLRVDEKDGSRTRYDVAGMTAVRGTKAELHCPVYGHPKPDIVWRFGESEQILGSGETFIIENVDDQNDGVYICTATNTIFTNGNRQRYKIDIERRLRIKSEFAWLLPLSIILVIVILLVSTILFFECRKKRHEQKSILDED